MLYLTDSGLNGRVLACTPLPDLNVLEATYVLLTQLHVPTYTCFLGQMTDSAEAAYVLQVLESLPNVRLDQSLRVFNYYLIPKEILGATT